MNVAADKWIRFLRQYGPIPRNDNMYDETIQRSARRLGISPIEFPHPFQDRLLECFCPTEAAPTSLILTGTAGDGKTHLCRQVWSALGGDVAAWSSDDPYLSLKTSALPRAAGTTSGPVTIHFIRDLSGWAPQLGADWETEKEALLHRFCESIFNSPTDELFLIAANDGQLIEAWRRLKDTDATIKARALLEDWLVEDRQEDKGVRLRFFNLSCGSSADLFDRAVESFINHPGWTSCFEDSPGENDSFGPKCPIRHNFELLKDALVRSRLRALFELCDHNGLHVPVRQILLLLTNAVLGHPDAKDHLMRPSDIPNILSAGTTSRASLFNNIFGGNLPEMRRQAITIFDYFDRFQIGYETSNRIDNVLIFGDADENLKTYFAQLVAQDKFYGADVGFDTAKQQYIEGNNDDPGAKEFLPLLISQRRGLFFKIPTELEEDLKLWELTVFKFAGEYLEDVVGILKSGGVVKRPILARIVKGLNRIFTGMLINSEREVHLATSGNNSQAKVSRISIDRISVTPSKGESVHFAYDGPRNRVVLHVQLGDGIVEELVLNLVRYEFLSRIALDGALPASFSKECYEDILAFKSRLLVARNRRAGHEQPRGQTLDLKLLTLSDNGAAEEKFIEIAL